MTGEWQSISAGQVSKRGGHVVNYPNGNSCMSFLKSDIFFLYYKCVDVVYTSLELHTSLELMEISELVNLQLHAICLFNLISKTMYVHVMT